MAKSSERKVKKEQPRRGVLARPLDALVFLLPLIAFYQVAVWRAGERVVAFDLLGKFFELFGQLGSWAPALAVIIILLATHAASGERWRVQLRQVLLMYGEAVVLAVPILVLNRAIRLAAAEPAGLSAFDEVALSVGAGIYEELVFRLVLVTLLVIVGVDLLRQPQGPVAAVAVVVSSLAFAAHHHPPLGAEQFGLVPFIFRTAAGVYLAMVFWFRGYGPAAGCHAAYNVAAVLVGT
ncbi:MAG TPA: CPBP family glutamic-type intramembrane protease [Phycisphaerae bacterium]|nr:CPBP family glutamic-type intramembrane protease [Phycisphaerae bacterium]HNU46342.1 CPBP family glutamic-type intramembrane protease [Phycisphaerae bacterium]